MQSVLHLFGEAVHTPAEQGCIKLDWCDTANTIAKFTKAETFAKATCQFTLPPRVKPMIAEIK